MNLKAIIQILKEAGFFQWVLSLFKKRVSTEEIEKAYEDAKTTKDPSDLVDTINNRK